MKIAMADKESIRDLMKFIDESWQKGHILSKNLDLMDFMHYNKDSGNYNFAYAVDEIGNINGVLGFIPVSHYSKSLKDNDRWLALWKSVSDVPGLGVSLLKYVTASCDSVGVVGINDKVMMLYKMMGYKTAVMNHHYILNNSVKEFRIAGISSEPVPDTAVKISVIERIDGASIPELNHVYRPLKNREYIINRYLKHPFYKYLFWGVRNESNTSLTAVLVARKIECSGSACLRIVDLFGDIGLAGSLYNGLQAVLHAENAEYIDFYSYGLELALLRTLGFTLRNGSNVIPNYFEPFVRSNIDIKVAYKSEKSPYLILKGDGDQDRPNMI